MSLLNRNTIKMIILFEELIRTTLTTYRSSFQRNASQLQNRYELTIIRFLLLLLCVNWFCGSLVFYVFFNKQLFFCPTLIILQDNRSLWKDVSTLIFIKLSFLDSACLAWPYNQHLNIMIHGLKIIYYKSIIFCS